MCIDSIDSDVVVVKRYWWVRYCSARVRLLPHCPSPHGDSKRLLNQSNGRVPRKNMGIAQSWTRGELICVIAGLVVILLG